jgi:hypothetical protein
MTMWVLIIVFVGGSAMIDPNLPSYEECEQTAHMWIKDMKQPITTRCVLVDVPKLRNKESK